MAIDHKDDDVNRLDAHVHIFENGYRPRPEHVNELLEYRQLQRCFSIRGALLIAYEGDSRYIGNSEHVLRVSQRYPELRALRYVPPDRAPSVSSWVDDFRLGYVGYSLYLDPTAPIVKWPSLRTTEAPPPILSINAVPEAWAKWSLTLLRSDAYLLVSHLGLPGRADARAEADALPDRLAPLLRTAPETSVFVKLSGLYAVDPVFPHEAARPVVERLLNAFGPERLMWGSDYSAVREDRPGVPPIEPEPWVSGLLNSRQQAMIYYSNLAGLLEEQGENWAG